MAISVNAVYRTVLSIMNKEGRGYLTPDQFNKIGAQVQLDLLEKSFFDYNRAMNRKKSFVVNDEYGDLPRNIKEKIDILSKEATLSISNGSSTLPVDLYRIINITSGSRTINLQEVKKSELSYINASKLTKPSLDYPDKTRLVILINPNNPTGSFVEKPAIDFLAEGLKKHPHVYILSDEIYSRQIFDGKEMPTFFNYPDLQERLIVLDGWSKAYSMTGWRMGWSVWPEKLIPHVTKLAINSFSCVNAPSQFAGIAALDGPDDSIHHMMEKFDQRRKLIHKGLNDLPGVTCSMPGGAFYAFPNVSGTGMNGSEFSKKCMHEAGVAIVPGTAFGKTSVDFVRFSFAASQDNIQKALDKISKMLK